MLNPITPEDQRILDWFEAQSEDTLRDLFERFDAVSPNEAWTAFLNDCTPPAKECPGDTLPPIPTKLTIAPRGYSWHGQKLQNDLDGLPCRPACTPPAQ